MSQFSLNLWEQKENRIPSKNPLTNTCGGCFSMTKELLTSWSRRTLRPSESSGRMFILVSWLGMLRPSWIISSCRICWRLIQIISAKSSHLQMTSLVTKGNKTSEPAARKLLQWWQVIDWQLNITADQKACHRLKKMLQMMDQWGVIECMTMSWLQRLAPPAFLLTIQPTVQCKTEMISQYSAAYHFWMVSRLLEKGAPFPESCCSLFHLFNSWSMTLYCSSLTWRNLKKRF